MISPSRSSPPSDDATSLNQLTAEQRERLSDVLDRYLAALEQDAPLSQESLLKEQPDLAPALRNYFRSLEDLHDMAAGFGGGEAGPEAGDDDEPHQQEMEGAKRIGDFELIREIGRGGMGVVYEARQISLDRIVAVKLLPFAAVLDAKQIARFKHEAHAAAQLHHPNIVPVFAIGAERGVHYYAMQYIDGQPLDRAIEELRQARGRKKRKATEDRGRGKGNREQGTTVAGRESVDGGRWSGFDVHGIEGSVEPSLAPTVEYSVLSTQHDVRPPTPEHRAPSALTPIDSLPLEHYRTVMRLGIQAAEALNAAHEYGVVHRDIKPSNLLLEASGKLWITDFGLARCQRDVSLTRTGDVVGTMRYMSPEQAAGQSALVDHRSDIYSLGVTLYELATLQPAFGEERGPALLRQIDAHDPPRPRQLRPDLPVDLETVILKAMSRERDDRYATAQQLAADLACVLEGKATTARPPTLLDRAGRWVRRRQRVVAVTLAALLLAVVGLSTSVAMIARAKNQASTNADRFEAMYQKAQEMIDELGMQSAEDLKYVSGAESERQRMLERTIRYLATLAEASKDQGPFQKTAGIAYAKIGGLEQQLGQKEKALQSHRESFAIFQRLHDQRPSDGDIQRHLARAQNNVGLALLVLGKVEDAGDQFKQASQLQERLLARMPSDLDVQSDLAASLSNLGISQQQLGQSTAADVSFTAAIDRLKRVIAGLADTPETKSKLTAAKEKLAAAYGNRATLELGTRPVEAASHHRQAIELLKSAAAEQPANFDLRRKLAASLDNLGSALSRAGQYPAARASHEEAIEICEDLVQRAPTRVVFRLDLAIDFNNLGMLETREGRLDAAEAAFERASSLYEEHLKRFAGDAAAKSSLGGVLNNLGIVLERADRLEEAAAAFAAAVTHQEAALAAEPQLPRGRETLEKTRANQARIQKKLAVANGKEASAGESHPTRAGSDNAPTTGLKTSWRIDYNQSSLLSLSGVRRNPSLLSRTAS